jgi:hypothetical protein
MEASMDAHEALLVAVVALAMIVDDAKKHLAWDLLDVRPSLETWTLQPPCLDAPMSYGCVLTLAGG